MRQKKHLISLISRTIKLGEFHESCGSGQEVIKLRGSIRRYLKIHGSGRAGSIRQAFKTHRSGRVTLTRPCPRGVTRPPKSLAKNQLRDWKLKKSTGHLGPRRKEKVLRCPTESEAATHLAITPTTPDKPAYMENRCTACRSRGATV